MSSYSPVIGRTPSASLIEMQCILTNRTTSPATGSFCQSLDSLRYVHNETGMYLPLFGAFNNWFVVNIYSHFFGAVLFATLPFYVYSKVYPRYTSAQLGDIIVFSTFFFGVAICFALSAWYEPTHWISCFPANGPAGTQLPYYSKP
jgi:hypothetical protein